MMKSLVELLCESRLAVENFILTEHMGFIHIITILAKGSSYGFELLIATAES